jgi:3-oxoacyl-[acyl-carrier protein] reductase
LAKDELPQVARALVGSRAIVTGAASGMGAATARLLAAAGAAVAVTDVTEDAAAAVAARIVAEGGTARAWRLDVGDARSIAETTQAIADALGGIDILVNNAGISRHLAVDAPDYDEHWDRHLNVLLTAHQRLIRAALPHLRRSDAPRIVNIASTEALGATSGFSAYSAAKAGVTGLTRGLAVELGREGITVNCICPGPIETGMTAAVPDDAKATYAHRRTALRRYGLPLEVAHMTLSLCVPAASFVTGATIPVDGGLMARNA